MSKPWPDEVRAMVAALTRDDVLSQVTPLSPTTWRVSVPYADADYGPGSMPWTCNGVRYRSWRVMRAELTRVAVLAPRIHDAVPDARVTTTTDGIEVSVGSKSVRWKRERNGWSLGDDLFTSDDRVIEHARAMAADAAAEAQWKLASDLATGLKAKGIETCTVRNLDTGVVTVSAESTLGHWHSAELRDGRWHYSGVEIATTAEAYRVLLEAAAPPKPAADRPPVEVEALVARLRTKYPDASIEAKHSHGEWHIDGERGTAGFGTRYEGGGWRYGGRPLLTGDEIAERVASLFDRHAPKPARSEITEEEQRVADEAMWLRVTQHLGPERAKEMMERAIKKLETHPAPTAPSLLERLRTAIPSLAWEQEDDGKYIGRDAQRIDRVVVTHQIDLGKNQAFIVTTAGDVAMNVRMQGFDAVVQHIGGYLHGDGDELVALPNHGSLGGVAIGNATLSRAAPQPSPRALDTDAALRAAGQRTEAFRDTLNEDPAAAAEAAKKLARTYTMNIHAHAFDPKEATATVQRLMSEHDKRAESEPTTTTSVLSRSFGDEHGERIAALLEAHKYSEAAALIEALTEELRAKQAAAKGPTTMTTKALDQAKVDASEAALRTAAKQLAKAARDPLAGAVARHLAPGDDSMRARVAALLETEAGLAMLKALLSLALGAIPQAGTRGAALAHELRVQAMADGADLALDVIAGPLREVVALYLQDAPDMRPPALGDGAEAAANNPLRASAQVPVPR